MMSLNIGWGLIAAVGLVAGLALPARRAVAVPRQARLSMVASGILLYIVIQVGYQAIDSVALAAVGGDVVTLGLSMAVAALGLIAGMVGLAWLEDRRAARGEPDAGPRDLASMSALGVGLHNLGLGLAFAQARTDRFGLYAVAAVVGLVLQNAAKGFAIGGPLAGLGVSWFRITLLALVAGGPLVLGSWFGALWVSPALELLCLSIGAGSLVFVLRERFRERVESLDNVAAMRALAVGLFTGLSTQLLMEIARGQVY